MVQNPTVEVFMLLPQDVFESYNFDRFIYIKHKDLQGYFFPERISNYKDGTVLVRMDLLYID